jgi:hypothetical protein
MSKVSQTGGGTLTLGDKSLQYNTVALIELTDQVALPAMDTHMTRLDADRPGSNLLRRRTGAVKGRPISWSMLQPGMPSRSPQEGRQLQLNMQILVSRKP